MEESRLWMERVVRFIEERVLEREIEALGNMRSDWVSGLDMLAG